MMTWEQRGGPQARECSTSQPLMCCRVSRSVSGAISPLLPGMQYNDTLDAQKHRAPCHTFFPLPALDIVPAERVVCSTMRGGYSARMLDATQQCGQFQIYTLFLA